MLATQVTGPLLVWWWAALGLGLVVAVVVVVLLQWLLTRVREIEEGADVVWAAGKDVARNTATTWMLGQAAGAVEEIRDEAMRHDALLKSRGV
jgi:hypothetical protein